MQYITPQKQIVKSQDGETYISIDGSPFTKVPGNQNSGANNDLFYYNFLKQFYLDIDLKNKPSRATCIGSRLIRKMKMGPWPPAKRS